MSAVRGALQAHQQAAGDRRRAENEMGRLWRDAAAQVIEHRFLAPLTEQDRRFEAALAELDGQLDRALNLIQG